MQRALRPLLIALLAALTVSGVVLAQAAGRVQINAKDTTGEALQGVKVIVTSDAMPKFFMERETNKKGKATLTFVDATKVYNFEFKYEDYPSQTAQIKPAIGSVVVRDITLNRNATAGGQVTDQILFSPAEKKFNEGVGFLQEKDFASAKARFLEALELDSEMSAAHSAVAAAQIQLGEFDAGIASAQRFMELEGESPRAYRLLYEAYSGKGDKAQADAALKSLSKLDTDGDAVALIYNEGVAAFQVGDYQAAKTNFEKALEIDPNLPQALSALGRIYLADKNYAGSAAMAERLLAVNPDDTGMMKVRYDAYRGAGDAANEKAAFDALAAADPKFLAADLYTKGAKLFDGGDIDGAKEELERVLAIDPAHAKAHYRLALCYVNEDQASLAKEHLQKFIELAPDDPEAAVAKDMLSYL